MNKVLLISLSLFFLVCRIDCLRDPFVFFENYKKEKIIVNNKSNDAGRKRDSMLGLAQSGERKIVCIGHDRCSKIIRNDEPGYKELINDVVAQTE